MKLKLMTYNIWGGQSYEEYLSGKPLDECTRDAAPFAEVIKSTGAEIVALNEVFNCERYGNQAEDIAKLAGFEYYHFDSAFVRPNLGGFYGNAILSKYPIIEINKKAIDAEVGVRLAETRSVMCATLDCNGKALDVIVSHFGLIEAEKERAVDAVLGFAKASANKCVFMGDMNSTRDSVHAERLREVFRASNDGGEEIKTWPVEPLPPEIRTYQNYPSFDRQIDYIFVGDGVRVNKTEAVYSLASDHKALCADVEI